MVIPWLNTASSRDDTGRSSILEARAEYLPRKWQSLWMKPLRRTSSKAAFSVTTRAIWADWVAKSKPVGWLNEFLGVLALMSPNSGRGLTCHHCPWYRRSRLYIVDGVYDPWYHQGGWYSHGLIPDDFNDEKPYVTSRRESAPSQSACAAGDDL